MEYSSVGLTLTKDVEVGRTTTVKRNWQGGSKVRIFADAGFLFAKHKEELFKMTNFGVVGTMFGGERINF